MLGTCGDPTSGTFSGRLRLVEEGTMGDGNDPGMDEGESARGIDAGLPTGVEVCMAGERSGAGGAICVLDLKFSIRLQRVSIWTSWASSLWVTSPNCSFNCEHSLQVLVDIAAVPRSLLSPLVLQSCNLDNHLGWIISTVTISV